MKITRINILSVTFFVIIIIYFLDFYLLENNANENFWCVEIIENYKFGNLENIKFPIHCDEGNLQISYIVIRRFF